jgi:RloB-like protein
LEAFLKLKEPNSLQSMSRKERFIRRSIFLACEGQTEEKYFQSIRDEVNIDSKFSVRVQVLEIESGVPQDPCGLVEEANRIKIEEGYDEAWAIFDKDREPNGQVRINAFNLAAQYGINIAFSSVAFEHWIILHFEKNDHEFVRSDCESQGEICGCFGNDCLCTHLRINHLNDYVKGGSYKLYNRIKIHNVTAIENCAWLKHQNRNNLSPTRTIQYPYDLNPHCDIDHLFIKILDLESVLFGEINATERFHGLHFTVLSYVNSNVSIRVCNDRIDAYVINNNCDFKLKSSDGILHTHTTASVLIEPGQTKDAELNFRNIPEGNLEFRFRDGGLVLIIPLVSN